MDILLVLIAVLAAFYFILLKPVLNQQRRQKEDISSLQPGDEVLTTGGFYALVQEINTREDGPMEILLEVAPGVVLRGTTMAIQEITRRADSDAEAASDSAPHDEHSTEDGVAGEDAERKPDSNKTTFNKTTFASEPARGSRS
ncbi:MAG: preprotein translocase subunit YajC [Dehalococcoidia bacterium]|nr:preprotein translocase subunit YajC [Dehalococcoidia bacterium]